MARITSQAAVEKIGNRYDLVLIASLRARELRCNRTAKIVSTNGPLVTAIREIEQGHIGREYLLRLQKPKKNK
jgi:DNA-directed RNA polymerase subunit omega